MYVKGVALCVSFKMLKLVRRDVPLSERLGENSPLAVAPIPPPTASPAGPNISWLPEAPMLGQDQPFFLMTPAAQALSGFFVWTALILTCHQVTSLLLSNPHCSFLHLNDLKQTQGESNYKA